MKNVNIRNIFGGRERVIKHSSGCTICLYPMGDFSSAYALFGTKYGSVDTTFKTKYDEDYITVPEGIAHYLEHKLFENDECDAFELYAKTGAHANTFTSFDCTAYLFASTQEFGENLKILLNLVQQPYFTDENVEKERGIITQEIKMYLDDPGTRVFYNCMEGVYYNNPARIDIAGTVESIQKIDKELLYRCYNTFYNLNNMVLSIAGNFDPDEALRICDELLICKEDPEIDVVVPEEPYQVKEKKIVQKLACAMPLFQLGFKIPYPENTLKDYLAFNIMLETALGDSSEFYNRLYDEGVINDSFGVGVSKGRGFFVPIICGIAHDPDRVTDEVVKELSRIKTEGLSRENVNTSIKMTYGELFSFDNAEKVARSGMMAQFEDRDIFSAAETAASLTYDDAMEMLNRLDLDNYCLSIVEPNN